MWMDSSPIFIIIHYNTHPTPPHHTLQFWIPLPIPSIFLLQEFYACCCSCRCLVPPPNVNPLHGLLCMWIPPLAQYPFCFFYYWFSSSHQQRMLFFFLYLPIPLPFTIYHEPKLSSDPILLLLLLTKKKTVHWCSLVTIKQLKT